MLSKTWFCQRKLQAPKGQGTEGRLSESASSPFLRIGSLDPAVENRLRVFTASRQRLITGCVVQVLVLLPARCATPGKPLSLSGPQRQVDTARPCVNLTRGEGSSGDEARLGWGILGHGSQDRGWVGIWTFLRDNLWPAGLSLVEAETSLERENLGSGAEAQKRRGLGRNHTAPCLP